MIRIYPLCYRSIGLSSEIDSTGSIAAIEAAIDHLNRQRNELEEIWAMRKMKLELYLRLRVFERDALEVSGRETVVFTSSKRSSALLKWIYRVRD